jgi:Putative  PD-(D/E)XK family member, (DUF4420)
MLFEAYMALTRKFPAGYPGLYGDRIQQSTDMWLAVDPQSFPSLLFAAQPSDTRSDIELRVVEVRFSRDCEIVIDDGSALAGTYTIVRLEENDPELVRLFLRLLEEAFCGSNAPATNRAIGDRIMELANLFRKAESSSKDIIGLWGELFVIAGAASKENAVRRWCLHRNAKYDFVSEAFAIEVKATVKPMREHHFALEQLRPLDALTVYVASVQLVQVQGGKAVFQLMDEILAAIGDSDLRYAFLGLCLVKGGEDIYRSNLRYKLLSSEAGVAFFAANDVTVPSIDANAPISNVSFDVCLDAVPQLPELDRARLMRELSA